MQPGGEREPGRGSNTRDRVDGRGDGRGYEHTVLVLWADPERGVRSVGRALCGTLEGAPHHLEVAWVDFPESMAAGAALVSALTTSASDRP